MFYSNELLSLKKGRFGILWLAATRGTVHVNKRDVMSVNIAQSSKELLEYVNGAKKSRISLYLSAQLMFGLCRIYVEKMTIILREAQDLYSRSLVTFRPQSIQIYDYRKRRGKKRSDVDIEIPMAATDDFGSFGIPGQLLQSQLDFEITMPTLENSFSLQARAEDITLIDAGTTPKDFKNEFSADIFGEKSALPDASNTELFHSTAGPSHRMSLADLVYEDKENRLPIEELLPQERSSQRPGTSSNRLSSIYELDRLDEQVISTGNLQAISTINEIEQQVPIQPEVVVESQVLEAAPAITNEERIPYEAASKEAVEVQVGSQSPKLQGQDAQPEEVATGGVQPTPPQQPQQEDQLQQENQQQQQQQEDQLQHLQQPIELECPQPCAASSAVKSRALKRTHPVPQISLQDLRPSQLPPAPASRRKRPASCLLVDGVLQLSKVEMRHNIEAAAAEQLRSRADVLAPSSRLTHPKRARSLNVARLLALPTNWELAISLKLGGLWRSNRRLCEALSQSHHHELPSSTIRHHDSLSTTGRLRFSKSSLPLNSLRESLLEASREEPRRANDSSSFGGVYVSRTSPSMSIRASSALEEGVNNSLQQTLLHQPAATIPEEEMPQKTDMEDITLVVAPAEVELPQMATPQVELQPATQQPPPTISLTELPDLYTNEDSLLSTIEQHFNRGVAEVEFSQLLVPTMTRKNAAKSMHHLLCLLKRRKLSVSQIAPFEPILITSGS